MTTHLEIDPKMQFIFPGSLGHGFPLAWHLQKKLKMKRVKFL